ncbi:hypothetical protein ACFVAR_23515 [Bacillus subtilis]
MDSVVRKKSPRAPSMPLTDALERTVKLYEKEGRHATSVDVVAQGLGYKDSKNGRAAQALASLRYYGLVERPKEGYLAVSKDFESYQFAPSASIKRDLLIKMLTTPPVFAELLEKYEARLPSDATIKFDLIQKGFSSGTADNVVALFRESVGFVGYYESSPAAVDGGDEEQSDAVVAGDVDYAQTPQQQVDSRDALSDQVEVRRQSLVRETSEEMVRIPVRLPKNRQAWLEIPIPFFEADKARLKAYIDLQLTDDEEGEAED